MNELLAKTILRLAEIDQEARFLADIDPKIKKFIVYSVDAAHGYRIRGWIRDYGYPTKENVGEEALHAFWLLVQHQDFDPPLMENCLAHCDFSPEDIAFLTDRIAMAKGLPQTYGTQFHVIEGVRTTYPIENAESVDKRRAEKGMEPLDSYIKKQ